MQRYTRLGPPPRQAPQRLQLLLLLGAALFAATVATLYIFASTERFSVQQLVERSSKLRSGGLAPPPPRRTDGRAVWWHAPFFSGSGMGTEALQLVLGLQRYTEYGKGRLWITSHGDEDKLEVFSGLPSATQQELAGMVQAALQASWDDARAAIIVCSSEPGAWALPAPLYQTSLCPPVPVGQAAYVVARAMFESDRLSPLHVQRCGG